MTYLKKQNKYEFIGIFNQKAQIDFLTTNLSNMQF